MSEKLNSSFNYIHFLNCISTSQFRLQTNKETATRPEYIEVVETHGGNYHESDSDIREVHIMNPKHEDRASSFFAQPGVLAGTIFINKITQQQKKKKLPKNSKSYHSLSKILHYSYQKMKNKKIKIEKKGIKTNIMLHWLFSGDWRSSCRSSLCHPSGDVHCVQDAQEGRGFVRAGRAEEVAGDADVPEARCAASQPGVLCLRQQYGGRQCSLKEEEARQQGVRAVFPSEDHAPPPVNSRGRHKQWHCVIDWIWN